MSIYQSWNTSNTEPGPVTFAIAKQQRGTKQAWQRFSKTSAVIGCQKTPVLVWTEIEFRARWGCPQVLRNNPYQSICSFARATSKKIHKRAHPTYFFVLLSLCSRFGVAMLRETSPSCKYINKTRVNKVICWTLLWYSFSPISNAVYPKILTAKNHSKGLELIFPSCN